MIKLSFAISEQISGGTHPRTGPHLIFAPGCLLHPKGQISSVDQSSDSYHPIFAQKLQIT